MNEVVRLDSKPLGRDIPPKLDKEGGLLLRVIVTMKGIIVIDQLAMTHFTSFHLHHSPS